MPLRFQRATAGIAALALAVTLAACGGAGDSGDTRMGTLSIKLTDGQSCDYREVNVSVTAVRFNRSDSAGEQNGWETWTIPTPKQIDLMTLSNGALEDLGTVPLSAGTYRQVRLVLAPNGSAPYANNVMLADGTVFKLTTPSAQQSGVKLKTNVTVEPGQLADLVLDFDPCQSVVRRGSSGQYNLKPVVTAYAESVNAVTGYTAPRAWVSAQQSGASVKSTVADSTGKFVLWPVVAGNYDIVIAADGRANAVLTGLAVGSGENVISALATPLLAATSTMAVVAGSVTPADASVRALQSIPSGPTIEVARKPVDADTGVFSFTLATGAPEYAAWVAGSAPYTFATAPTAAGQYTFEATSAGYAPKTSMTITLSAGTPIAVTPFQFP